MNTYVPPTNVNHNHPRAHQWNAMYNQTPVICIKAPGTHIQQKNF
jgi:hypothetical protein